MLQKDYLLIFDAIVCVPFDLFVFLLLSQLVFRRLNLDTYRDDEFSNAAADSNGDLFVTETIVEFDADSFVRLAIAVRTGD